MINGALRMYCTYTLPWFWKALIVAYDLCKCFLLQNPERSPASVLHTTLSVFFLQAMLCLVLVAPSLCLSVADRVKTNVFVSEMLLLLAAYLLLIRCMARGVVSPEHACFSLQFCSCYCFFCFFHATSGNRKLLLGSGVVKWCSLGGMCLFPLCYSHLLQDCMHLSPYVLVFAFSGEVSGWACACCSHLLGAVEHVVNALYVRLCENV